MVAALAPMLAAERGAYQSMLWYLYQNDGRMAYDLGLIGGVCNCGRNFSKVWSRIEGKFVVKDGVLKHKKVTKILRKIKKKIQAKRRAGLRGAAVTWQKHSSANGKKEANNTNTNQNQLIVNIGFEQSAPEEVLVLHNRIRTQIGELCDHITRTFQPREREKKTLTKILAFMASSIQADPDLEHWLTDAKEWATIAHQDGKKDRGLPLFVEAVKENTGWRSNPMLLKGKS